MALSIELALLLSSQGDRAPMDGTMFSYAGRQVLKGVMNERPYPLISIDVERSASRRKVSHFERALGGAGELISPIDIHAFAHAFVTDEKLIMPWLKISCSDKPEPQLPSDYLLFESQWNRINIGVQKQEKNEKEAAESADHGEKQALDESITELAREAVERANQIPNRNLTAGIPTPLIASEAMKQVLETQRKIEELHNSFIQREAARRAQLAITNMLKSRKRSQSDKENPEESE